MASGHAASPGPGLWSLVSFPPSRTNTSGASLQGGGQCMCSAPYLRAWWVGTYYECVQCLRSNPDALRNVILRAPSVLVPMNMLADGVLRTACLPVYPSTEYCRTEYGVGTLHFL